jgi:hypothetical protein
VDVVDDEAHIEGRVPAQRLEDVGGRIFVPRHGAEGGNDGGREVLGLFVAGTAGDPYLDARRLEGMVPHRLSQHGRLAEPGPGHH